MTPGVRRDPMYANMGYHSAGKGVDIGSSQTDDVGCICFIILIRLY